MTDVQLQINCTRLLNSSVKTFSLKAVSNETSSENQTLLLSCPINTTKTIVGLYPSIMYGVSAIYQFESFQANCLLIKFAINGNCLHLYNDMTFSTTFITCRQYKPGTWWYNWWYNN